MMRVATLMLLLSAATGCASNGGIGVPGVARVPPPATNSYGKPDNGYYNGGVSPSGPQQGLGAFGAPTNDAFASNSPPSLNWRSPGGSVAGGYADGGMAIGPEPPPAAATPWGASPASGRVAPVSYSEPVLPSARGMSEPSIRIPDSGLQDISHLPRVTHTPQIRGTHGGALAGPSAGMSQPTPNFGTTTPSNNLTWR